MLQDPESYENMRNAIGILKILSISEEEIKNGKVILSDAVFERVQEKLQ